MKKNILAIAALSVIFSIIFTAKATSNQNSADVSTIVPKTGNSSTDNISNQMKEIIITNSWARKSISPNNNSAAYMKITNPTDKDVIIIGASASVIANNVELHKSFVDEKGISRMTSIDKIIVPAKTTIELSPGAIHLMLFDLKRSLNNGDRFDIEVKIEGSRPLTVSTEVK